MTCKKLHVFQVYNLVFWYIYINPHETITTIKKVNISITSKSSLVPLFFFLFLNSGCSEEGAIPLLTALWVLTCNVFDLNQFTPPQATRSPGLQTSYHIDAKVSVVPSGHRSLTKARILSLMNPSVPATQVQLWQSSADDLVFCNWHNNQTEHWEH